MPCRCDWANAVGRERFSPVRRPVRSPPNAPTQVGPRQPRRLTRTILAAAAVTLVARGLTAESAGAAPPTPATAGVDRGSPQLGVDDPGSGNAAGWQIRHDGSLRKVGEFGGLPQTVNGGQPPVDFGAGGSPAGIAVI